MIYLISIEADAPPAAIEVFEDRIQALPTIWFVYTPWSAEEICSHLQSHLGPKDSLIVESVSGNVEWLGNVRSEVRDWLERHSE
jgi:hypothetical protein